MAGLLTVPVDKIVDEIGADTWDDVSENHHEWVWDEGTGAAEYARQNDPDLSEDDLDNIRQEAELEANGALYRAYQSAVEDTVGLWFEGLSSTIEPNAQMKAKFDWDKGIVEIHATSMDALAKVIVDCINGYGSFHFNNVQDALESGPYTLDEFVKTHAGWLSSYGAIYGDDGLNNGRTYARHFEINTRYL